MKFLILVLAILITGCDTVGGIRHYAKLESLPELECVEKTLSSIRSISNFKVVEEEGGRQLKLTGLTDPEKVYRYFYSVSDLNGNFYFTVNYENKIEYTHTYMYLNRAPSQEEVDIILPVMISIENQLSNNCGVNEFENNISRYCTPEIECI